MKIVKESDVIDLNKYRRERSLKQTFDDKETVKKIDSANTENQYAVLARDVEDIYNNLKVPGFKNFTDLWTWLNTGWNRPGFPSAQININSLTANEKSKLEMIAFHAPRLIARLEQAQKRVHHFLDVNPSGDSADQAAYLDHAISEELRMLRDVARMVK